MQINIAPLSKENPVLVDEEEYTKLVNKNKKNWSNCDSHIELLAKLHYLKRGLESKKITVANFDIREERLVISWLRKNM